MVSLPSQWVSQALAVRRALGVAFVLTVEGIERRTGLRWCDDAFTAESIRHGLNLFISRFGQSSKSVLPKKLKDAAASLPPELAHHYSEPSQIGLSEAGAVISLVERWRGDDVFQISQRATILDIHFPNEWFAHAQLLRDLAQVD
jgi:hypothetical protein